MLWKFDIEYKSGKQIKFADATSRHPISSYAELASVNLQSPEDAEEHLYVESLKQQANSFETVTWNRVREASLSDDEVAAFDNTHGQLLQRVAGEEFAILHRIDAHLLRAGQPNNTERFYRQ